MVSFKVLQLVVAAISLLSTLSSPTAVYAAPTDSAALAAVTLKADHSPVSGKYFDRIVIIMLENKNFIDTVKQSYFKTLGARGRVLTKYAGLTHPSEPNYIGTIFGSLDSANMDFDVDLPYTNLVDLLEAKDVSWKAYMEEYPGDCFAGEESANGLYRRKHNPFISANNIRENPTRCAKIVNADEFQHDLDAGRLPQYSFYTPNMNNDGHDTNLDYAANWLKGFLEPKLTPSNLLRDDTLVVVTFDENDYQLEDNLVWTGLIGSAVRQGEHDNTAYNHYDLLRTVEDNWSLGTLEREDAKAKGLQNLRARKA